MVTLRGNNNTGVSNGGGTTARIIPASLPTKLEYVEGEALDTSGLTLNFEEVGSEPSSISTFSTIPNNGTNLTRHNESIQVDYKNDGKIYSLNIPIKVKYPVGLRVNYLKKNNYNIDESIDLAGADIVIVYNDNSEKSIENNTGVTTTPTTYDGSTKLIKFSYSNGDIELNTNYEINKSKELAGYVDPRIVTFASGSWEDIASMLTRHKNGEINIADYWKAGDTRKLYNMDGKTQYGTLVIYELNGTLEDGTKYNVAIGRKDLLGNRPTGLSSNINFYIFNDIRPNFFYNSSTFTNSIFGNECLRIADLSTSSYQDNILNKHIDGTYKKISKYYNDSDYKNYKDYGANIIDGCMVNDKVIGYRNLYKFIFYGSDYFSQFDTSMKIYNKENGVSSIEYGSLKLACINMNLALKFNKYIDIYRVDFFANFSDDNLSPLYKSYYSGNYTYYKVFNKIKYKCYKERALYTNYYNGIIDGGHTYVILNLGEENIFGDSAFEYFKTAQNRIFTYNGKPSKYILPNYAMDETIFDNKEYEYTVSGKYDLMPSNSFSGAMNFIVKDNHMHPSGHKKITKLYKIVDENGSLVNVLAGVKRFDATSGELQECESRLYRDIASNDTHYCLSPQCFFL